MNRKPENTLIAILGLSPELLYNGIVAFKKTKKIEFNHIIILTTELGKKSLEGWAFDINVSIVVPENSLKQKIEDVFSDDNNESFFKTTFRTVYQESSNINSKLFFLITGGTTNMSLALVLAAQFYAREGDEIYSLYCDNDTKFNLIKIPYLMIKGLERFKGLSQISPDSFFERNEDLNLVINLQQRSVLIGKYFCKIPDALFALYLFFIYQKVNCKGKCNNCKSKGCFIEQSEVFKRQKDITKIYQQLSNKHYNLSQSGVCSLSKENFRSYKAKINSLIFKSFPLEIAQTITIESFQSSKKTVFGIKKIPERILIA